jgi:Bacterial type II and III secretion system protein
MSRRKILLLTGVPALIAIGLGFYVPRYFSPIPGLIEELRSCLEPTDEEASGAQADVEPRQCIRLEIVVMMVNLDKTRMPLLADRENADQVVCGVVRDRDRMLTIVQQLRRADCLANVTEPTMLTVSGQPGSVMVGGQMLILAEDGMVAGYKHYGTSVKVLPTLQKDGRIHLQAEVELSEPKRSDRTNGVPEFNLMEAKSSILVRDGQTCFIGGVKWKNRRARTTQVPLLSNLPGIGTWFQFTRERDIEEELLLLVTPRLVAGP